MAQPASAHRARNRTPMPLPIRGAGGRSVAAGCAAIAWPSKSFGFVARERPMPSRLMIINGPNLNLLGIREPHIYGSTRLDAIEKSCREFAGVLDVQLAFHQSNHEGVIVDLIQSARESADAIIVNPAGFSFTSVAIIDALKIFEGPIIELHVSNIHARDELHRHSKVSASVTAVICGLGPYGYIVAMQAAVQRLGRVPDALPQPVRVGPV